MAIKGKFLYHLPPTMGHTVLHTQGVLGFIVISVWTELPPQPQICMLKL